MQSFASRRNELPPRMIQQGRNKAGSARRRIVHRRPAVEILQVPAEGRPHAHQQRGLGGSHVHDVAITRGRARTTTRRGCRTRGFCNRMAMLRQAHPRSRFGNSWFGPESPGGLSIFLRLAALFALVFLGFFRRNLDLSMSYGRSAARDLFLAFLETDTNTVR